MRNPFADVSLYYYIIAHECKIVTESSQKPAGRMNKILPGNWKSGEDFEPLRFFDALTLRRNLLHAVHPGAKHFRNDHAAVRLLELLDDGGHQAAGGQAGAIERVHKLQLLGFVAAEAPL